LKFVKLIYNGTMLVFLNKITIRLHPFFLLFVKKDSSPHHHWAAHTHTHTLCIVSACGRQGRRRLLLNVPLVKSALCTSSTRVDNVYNARSDWVQRKDIFQASRQFGDSKLCCSRTAVVGSIMGVSTLSTTHITVLATITTTDTTTTATRATITATQQFIKVLGTEPCIVVHGATTFPGTFWCNDRSIQNLVLRISSRHDN
jgi:hypothetical protein